MIVVVVPHHGMTLFCAPGVSSTTCSLGQLLVAGAHGRANDVAAISMSELCVSKATKAVLLVVLGFAFLNSPFSFDRLSGVATFLMQRHFVTSISHTMTGSQAESVHVFCYGDSLTAGTSPPEYRRSFPYAPHLEQALQQLGANVTVRHLGLPGWTSSELLSETDGPESLRTAVKQAPAQVVILLAGTNDLGYTYMPELEIADSVIGLHRQCHAEGVPHTVAIGIPPSAYQAKVAKAARRAATINEALMQYCKSEPKATFVPFPFGFDRDDDKWAPDGLHFSSKGYEVLGIRLAPVVQKILKL